MSDDKKLPDPVMELAMDVASTIDIKRMLSGSPVSMKGMAVEIEAPLRRFTRKVETLEAEVERLRVHVHALKEDLRYHDEKCGPKRSETL